MTGANLIASGRVPKRTRILLLFGIFAAGKEAKAVSRKNYNRCIRKIATKNLAREKRNQN
jgi:hypothetical protein